MASGVLWGKRDISFSDASYHFLVVGASGSGKTTLIRRLLWSLYEDQDAKKQNHRSRGLIYDPKQEFLRDLDVMGVWNRVKILQPFDKRCYAWDIAADLKSIVDLRQFASILVPNRGASDASRFFDDAVRDLLTGALVSLAFCAPNAKEWTFRDLLLGVLYPANLDYLLKFDVAHDGTLLPMMGRLRETYLSGDPRTTSNIRATLSSCLSIFEPIAAIWELARQKKRTFSVEEWIKSDDVLVLGNDETSRASLDVINQALFKRLSEVLLGQPEISEADREQGRNVCWVVLDEVREAGKLDGLSRLLTKARSKGVSVTLGFQDIDGLREVYGKEIAQEIAGQCQNIAILQVSNPSTAEWASNLFGKVRVKQPTNAASIGTDGKIGLTQTTTDAEKMQVESGELLYLPRTSPANGLTGHFRLVGRPYEHVNLNWASLIEPYLPGSTRRNQTKNAEENFLRRDAKDYFLLPWDQEDWKRLGFDGEPPPWRSEPNFTKIPTAHSNEPRDIPQS